MAEATDRPQGAEEVSTAAAPAVAESYRPLSLLALAGFGLAVVYALIVVVGGLVALIGRVPWLMPSWTFLLPLAALAVCWAARTHIRASENTLSGLAFTTWGFRITIVVALTYGAYYGATFFVIRHQATTYADNVFEEIKQGRVTQSFLLAIGLPANEVDRDMLEVKFNAPMGPSGTPGPYSRYRQSEFVRLLELGGEQAQIVPMSVLDWEHGSDGYRVALRYHVISDVVEFDMNVETLGHDFKPGEGKGRQWRIPLEKGGIRVVPESVKPTEKGAELFRRVKMAQTLLQGWVEKFHHREWAEIYLDTLPPSERSRQQEVQKIARAATLAPLGGAALLGLCDAACRDFLAGKQTLQTAKLIQFDDKFWAGKQHKEAIRQRIEQTFRPSSTELPPVQLRPTQAIPRIIVREGRTTVVFDLGLNYMDESGQRPEYIVEGRLFVSTDSSEADRNPSAWRIESITVDAGRTRPTPPQGQPPRGGGPGGPPRSPERLTK